MGAIKGITLAKHIQNNLTSNNWIPINDYDLKKYLELASKTKALFLLEETHMQMSFQRKMHLKI